MKQLMIRFGSALAAGLLFFGAHHYSLDIFAILLAAAFVIILVFEWPKLCRNNKWLWALTPFYPVLPMLLVGFGLSGHPENGYWPNLFPFFIAWGADTGGYVFGKLFGRHKICPSISPKKSWEGLFGSFIFVFMVFRLYDWSGVSMFSKYSEACLSWMPPLVLMAFLTVAALLGDLFESYLKRRAGVKDAGGIMPGHGGLLDRFDSVFGVVIAKALLLLPAYLMR